MFNWVIFLPERYFEHLVRQFRLELGVLLFRSHWYHLQHIEFNHGVTVKWLTVNLHRLYIVCIYWYSGQFVVMLFWVSVTGGPINGIFFIGELTRSRAPPVLTDRVIVRRRRPWKIQTVRRTWRCRRGGVIYISAFVSSWTLIRWRQSVWRHALFYVLPDICFFWLLDTLTPSRVVS